MVLAKPRWWFPVLLGLFMLGFLASDVTALSKPAATISVTCHVRSELLRANSTCLSGHCFLQIKHYDDYSDVELPVSGSRVHVYSDKGLDFTGIRNMQATVEFVSLLELLCIENVSAIESPIIDRAEILRTTDRDYFSFEPLSMSRVKDLEAEKRDLSKCYYEDYERVADWMIVTTNPNYFCIQSPTLWISVTVPVVVLVYFVRTKGEKFLADRRASESDP